MPDPIIPIDQLIRNYLTNLPVFPPEDFGELHAFMLDFYRDFRRSANAHGIPETEQPNVVEHAQKVLWAFARCGQAAADDCGPVLAIGRVDAQAAIKIPRVEETFRLLGDLGAQVLYQAGGEWSLEGKRKESDALGLRFPGKPQLAQALTGLAEAVRAGTDKDKAAYERFLRVNPRAVLAREKPSLDLPPDDLAILANLPEGPREAWQELAQSLARYTDFFPTVEFRSIHHGMWTVNYESRRATRDLCGLIAQNGEMTARVILYGEKHFMVKERLELFGDAIRAEFFNAHYYEEFEHQWLFVPVAKHEDAVGVEKLLAFIN